MIVFSWFFVLEISTSSPGIIRPDSEITLIRSPYSGVIKKSFLRENQLVDAGDTLYEIESEALIIRQKYLMNKLIEARMIVGDLKVLTNKSDAKSIQTDHVNQSWITFLQKIAELNIRLNKVRGDYNRSLKLYNEKVIADAEFEGYKYQLDHAISEVALTRKLQMNEWQRELISQERDMNSIESELAVVERDLKSRVVLSPVKGTVQGLTGIYPGSVVFANQDLAQISPESALIVETYVSPGNIGLLRNGMKVRILVDAFNYNQWGFGEGTVIDISNDVHIINDRPVFEVRCSLDKGYLKLENGRRGELKKGMSLQARFIVTERTLWQLLYDKVDDWLNPGL
jgi:HlyD family secretion protein